MSSFGNRRLARTAEYQRIFSLPVRGALPPLEELSSLLSTREGRMRLRPLQSQAFFEMGEQGGMFGPIRVGHGKTIISLLSPYVLDSARPLLLIPAALVEKTENERRELSKHWRIPGNLRIVSYEMLSRVRSENLLSYYRPDLIVADECHRLKNRRAGVTRRVVRYMRENPTTRFVGMSGTVIGKSLKDYAHILRWCLKGNAPVPATDDETDLWADALDADVNPLSRVDSSILGPTIDAARKTYSDRVLATPGVVASGGDDVPCSLNIVGHVLHPTAVTEENFRTLRDTWSRPDGYTFVEASLLWMYARELALGLHYMWDPPGPVKWREARKAWTSFARETISHSRSLDTEMHVAQAVDRGDIVSPELHAWRRIRDTFRPNVIPVWHDDNALSWCGKWLKEEGICWVEHVFFARELSRRTGLPYYGAEGLCDGWPIEKAEGPIIASVAANSTGRNLQKWSRNLVVSPMSGAKEWEQLLGRTHRSGQTADEITVDVLFACRENWDSFAKAIVGAQAVAPLVGEQKILIATKAIPHCPRGQAFRTNNAKAVSLTE